MGTRHGPAANIVLVEAAPTLSDLFGEDRFGKPAFRHIRGLDELGSLGILRRVEL